MVVAPLVPAVGVEIADSSEETASSVGAPMEVQAPVVVAAARDCVHTGVHREARQRAWTERLFSEGADKFGEIGDVYMDGKKTSGSALDTMIEHVAPAGSCAAPAPVTEHSPTATCAAPDTVIEYVATTGTCAAPAPVTEYVPTAANAAPDTVIEYVAPAGTCAAPAPASARWRVHHAGTSSVLCCTSSRRVLCRTSARRRVQRASNSGSPRFTTEHAPTNACATPDTLIEYVASAGTCAAPAPVFEAECDEDASPKSTYGPLVCVLW